MNTEFDNLQPADGMENVQNEVETTQTEATAESSEMETTELVEEVENVEVADDSIPEKDYQNLTMESIIDEMKHLLGQFAVYKISKPISELKNHFLTKLNADRSEKEAIYKSENPESEDFFYENPLKKSFDETLREYKKQLNAYFTLQEKEQQENLKIRLQLIEDLKSLYQSNTNDSNQNIFKKFRDIRTKWHDTGIVPKANANDVYKTYYHHLDNFYEYLTLNKELRDMDLAHNLETRNVILKRAQELVEEPNILKALNELQYLHKRWKEDASPVSDEHKDSTWEIFKELTQLIHNKRTELTESIRVEQEENLAKKKAILVELASLNEQTQGEVSHKVLQKNAELVEKLREEFFQLGRVPKEVSNEIWTEFKSLLKDFNQKKNVFYKSLKSSQNDNLKAKNELLQIAIDNKTSEDWETALQLYKKIQKDWRNVGHVPRKISDKIWIEFQTACNEFFDRYKNRNNELNESFEENYTAKASFLTDLATLTLSEDKTQAFATIKEWNAKWNALGKVPRDKMEINSQFQQLITEKIQLAKLKDSDIKSVQGEMQIANLKASGDERKLNDEIVKVKKQISEVTQEIAQLENNLGFFSNASSDNPLLKNTRHEIERKKASLESLKSQLHKLHHIDLNAVDEVIPETSNQEE